MIFFNSTKTEKQYKGNNSEKNLTRIDSVKPGSHLCDKHNTSDISISISRRKKEHVPFFLCLCLCLCCLCYAYRTSGNQALGDM